MEKSKIRSRVTAVWSIVLVPLAGLATMMPIKIKLLWQCSLTRARSRPATNCCTYRLSQATWLLIQVLDLRMIATQPMFCQVVPPEPLPVSSSLMILKLQSHARSIGLAASFFFAALPGCWRAQAIRAGSSNKATCSGGKDELLIMRAVCSDASCWNRVWRAPHHGMDV